MKKIFIVLLVIGLLGALITNDNLIHFFQKIKTKQLQKNEYFKKLSLKYYGSPNYGKELALINQTLKLNTISSEEEMIIPSLDALIQFYETYDISLTTQEVLSNQNAELSPQNLIQRKLFKSSIVPPFVGVIIILAITIGYILGRKRSKRELKLNFHNMNKPSGEMENDLATIQNKDEILIDYKEM